jgi:hypothetical protein
MAARRARWLTIRQATTRTTFTMTRTAARIGSGANAAPAANRRSARLTPEGAPATSAPGVSATRL